MSEGPPSAAAGGFAGATGSFTGGSSGSSRNGVGGSSGSPTSTAGSGAADASSEPDAYPASSGGGDPTAPSPVLAACDGRSPASASDVWIAFDSDRQNFNRDIYVVRPDGTALTRLTEAPSSEREPAISPDGRVVVFTSDRDGLPQIYAMNLLTRAVTRLTSRVEGADQASFSKSGDWLAFHSGASVYIMPSGGGPEKLVATGDGTFNAFFYPHFLSGDTELTFDRNNEIRAVTLDGSAFRYIVGNTTTSIKSPSPSPTTSEIVYQTRCYNERAESLWTTPSTSSTPTCEGRRVSPPGDIKSARPAWGPDNSFAYERVLEVTNTAQIALISRVAGSRPCHLAPSTSDDRNPSWSTSAFQPRCADATRAASGNFSDGAPCADAGPVNSPSPGPMVDAGADAPDSSGPEDAGAEAATSSCDGGRAPFECVQFCGADALSWPVCTSHGYECATGMRTSDCPRGTCFQNPGVLFICCGPEGLVAPWCEDGNLQTCPAGTTHVPGVLTRDATCPDAGLAEATTG